MTQTAIKTTKLFPAMGTLITLAAYDEAGAAALDEAKERVLTLHDMWNAFDPDSEISRINRMAGRGFVKVSEDTLWLLEQAIRFSELTNGAFDVTAGASAMLWKQAVKTGRLPDEADIAAAKDLTGWRDIILDWEHETVMLRRRGQSIDLGAIAKGFAADEVTRLLREAGAENALMNLGGTVVSVGAPRAVGIQNPFASAGVAFAYTSVVNKAAVTSGLYEQQAVIGGQTVHHIVDPRTGRPAETELAGVTLIGENAMMLDALATAAFVTGADAALRLAKRFGAEAVFVTRDGNVFLTDGLQDNFRFL